MPLARSRPIARRERTCRFELAWPEVTCAAEARLDITSDADALPRRRSSSTPARTVRRSLSRRWSEVIPRDLLCRRRTGRTARPSSATRVAGARPRSAGQRAGRRASEVRPAWHAAGDAQLARPGRRAAAGSAGGTGNQSGSGSGPGASPIRISCSSCFASGTTESSARVYGCCGSARISRGWADLDDPAEVHHRDAIRDVPRQAQVVGDDEDGDLLVADEVEQQAQDLPADRRVEAGHRLVGHQQLGLHHHRPGDDHPLALPTRQLVGVAQEEPLRRAETAAGQCLRHPGLLVRKPVDARALGHDLVDRLAGVERAGRILEHELRLRGATPAARPATGRRATVEARPRPRSSAAARAPSGPAWSCRTPTPPPGPAPRPWRTSRSTPSTALATAPPRRRGG